MARPTLTRHRKFHRLERAVGRARGLGSLELLWLTGNESGDDTLGTPEDVESLAAWEGTPGVLFTALRDAGQPDQAGFIEEHPDRPGVWRIHDLWDHAPEYVQRRAAREADRAKRGKTLSDLRRDAARVRWSKREQPDASGMQVTDACNASGSTPAPSTQHPAPSPPPSSSNLAAAAPTSLGRLAGFRKKLGEALRLPQPVTVGNKATISGSVVGPDEICRFIEHQVATFGESPLLADCIELAKRSKTGPPSSLAWFVPFLARLPLPSGGERGLA